MAENSKIEWTDHTVNLWWEEPKSIIGMREQYVNTGTLRDNLFTEITNGQYPNLVFLFLTKRPENITSMIPIKWNEYRPSNVWFGSSISDKETAWKVRKSFLDSRLIGNIFYSIEPQIEDISSIDLRSVDWVIQGGESGHKRRPFHIDWAYKMRDMCREQHVPYFFKQIDKIQPIPEDLQIREFPNF